jgi:hypothetical protein
MFDSNSIYNCSIIDLRKLEWKEGNICFVEGLKDVPFPIKRIFYLYDVPGGASRGGHSHYKCHQLLIAGVGSFDVTVDDGKLKKTFTLNRPYHGLHIPPGIWATEHNFSSGSICLVVASRKYEEEDYIRDYQKFLALN